LALGRGTALREGDFAAGFLAFSFTTFLADFFAAAFDFALPAFLRVAILNHSIISCGPRFAG
jgi:hypothetical protein